MEQLEKEISTKQIVSSLAAPLKTLSPFDGKTSPYPVEVVYKDHPIRNPSPKDPKLSGESSEREDKEQETHTPPLSHDR